MKQCLQIDQVGNSRNDITQNNLKNFSATYLLKIGTCGQQRLEITAFFVVYARYRAPNTDLQIFYQFLLVHLVKKCECRKCKLLLSQSEHQRLKKNVMHSQNSWKTPQNAQDAHSGPSFTAIPADFDIFGLRFGILTQKNMKYVTSNPNQALEDYFEYRYRVIHSFHYEQRKIWGDSLMLLADTSNWRTDFIYKKLVSSNLPSPNAHGPNFVCSHILIPNFTFSFQF